MYYLTYDHRYHTFRLLKKTGKKTYAARSDIIVFGMFSVCFRFLFSYSSRIEIY